jgi:hypothetical protein
MIPAEYTRSPYNESMAIHKVKAWLGLILVLGCIAFAIHWALRGYRGEDANFAFRYMFVPICFVVVAFFSKAWMRISYDIDKERIPLSQINRGPRPPQPPPMPPLVIDLPTITPSFLISHAPTTHLKIVENQNPTVPLVPLTPHLTVVSRED